MKKPIHEKQNLALRLTGYTASAGALLAIGSSVNGQVVYSGLQNIEMNFPFDYTSIDMNDDGITDFAFYLAGYSYLYSNASIYLKYKFAYGVIMNDRTGFYNNSWMTRMDTRFTYYTYYGGTFPVQVPIVHGLETGVGVNDSQTMWSNIRYPSWPGALGVVSTVSYRGPYYSVNYSNKIGDFVGSESYIGTRFYIGSHQHYGWIRLSISDDMEQMKIIDWAYESTPGVGINAGAGTGQVINPLTVRLTDVPSVTFSPKIRVSIISEVEITGLDITDFVITNGTASNFQTVIEGKMFTVDITAFAPGYVVVVLPAGRVRDNSGNRNSEVKTYWEYKIPVSVESETDRALSIFPNPAKNTLYVQLPSEAFIQLFDIRGNLLYQQEHALNESIDISTFSPGLYIIRIQDKDVVSQHKVVIE